LQTTAGKMIFGKWDDRSARPEQRTTASGVTATVSAITNGETRKPAPVLAERPIE
jgi:hypothetical protein